VVRDYFKARLIIQQKGMRKIYIHSTLTLVLIERIADFRRGN
jgi:hypothetical protein